MKKEKDRQLGSNPAARDAGPGDNPDSKLEQILVRQAQESADRDAKWAQDAADRNAKWAQDAADRDARWEKMFARYDQDAADRDARWEKMFAHYVQESAENRALAKKNHAELVDILGGIRSSLDSLGSNLDGIRSDLGNYIGAEAKAMEDDFASALGDGTVCGFKIKKVLVRQKGSLEGRDAEYDIIAVSHDEKALFLCEIKRHLKSKDVIEFEKKRQNFVEMCHQNPGWTKEQFSFSRPDFVFGVVGGMRVMKEATSIASKANLVVMRLKNREVVIESRNGRPCRLDSFSGKILQKRGIRRQIRHTA